jgi:hypothetical protein
MSNLLGTLFKMLRSRKRVTLTLLIAEQSEECALSARGNRWREGSKTAALGTAEGFAGNSTLPLANRHEASK